MLIRSLLTVAAMGLIVARAVSAVVQVTTGISPDGSYFQVQSIPLPAVNDAGSNGKWSVLEGRVDANSGSIAVVSDGRVPTNADQPTQNFFFAAYASGSTISMNAEWFRGQLNREARGAVVHEMWHIVQGNPGRNRRVRNVVAPPGWIVKGIPDYIRWFLYEPHTKGAQLSPQALAKARHDGSYRVSANFIDWVIRQHPLDGKLLEQLNAAARQGKYSPETWKELTSKSEDQLAEAWGTGS